MKPFRCLTLFASAVLLAALTDSVHSAEPIPFLGKMAAWNGFDRYDFSVEGKPVLVVVPKKPAPGRPWVRHGEFFAHKSAPDIALLERGWDAVDSAIGRFWHLRYRPVIFTHMAQTPQSAADQACNPGPQRIRCPNKHYERSALNAQATKCQV